jgi:hypothetical protein
VRSGRIAYAGLGVLVTFLAIGIVIEQHSSWWQLLVFAIAPDISLLLGMSPGVQRGQLHPRAVPFYNAVHRFWAPAVLTLITFVLHEYGWTAGGLAWIAHIAFDRSLGFGLRTPEGFQRG